MAPACAAVLAADVRERQPAVPSPGRAGIQTALQPVDSEERTRAVQARPAVSLCGGPDVAETRPVLSLGWPRLPETTLSALCRAAVGGRCLLTPQA